MRSTRFKQIAPDQLEIQEDHEWSLFDFIFNLIFLGIFLFLILDIVYGFIINNESHLKVAENIICGAIGIYIGITVIAHFCKQHGKLLLLFDVSQGKIQKVWKPFDSFKIKDLNLHDYYAVALRKEIQSDESGESFKVQYIHLLGTDGYIELKSSAEYNADYSQIRENAIFLSHFLSLPLLESTEKSEI